MTRPTQPLREEHQDLLPHIEHLRQLADAVGNTPPPALAQNVAAVHDFLAHQLIPHAHAEDSALYPVVGRLMGAPEATASMSRDHAEVGALVGELAGLRDQLAGGAAPGGETEKALRRVLYGLYAIVKLHFAKEEEIYLPLLDARLSEVEAHEMFEQVEAAAAELRGGYGAHGHTHH